MRRTVQLNQKRVDSGKALPVVQASSVFELSTYLFGSKSEVGHVSDNSKQIFNTTTSILKTPNSCRRVALATPPKSKDQPKPVSEQFKAKSLSAEFKAKSLSAEFKAKSLSAEFKAKSLSEQIKSKSLFEQYKPIVPSVEISSAAPEDGTDELVDLNTHAGVSAPHTSRSTVPSDLFFNKSKTRRPSIMTAKSYNDLSEASRPEAPRRMQTRLTSGRWGGGNAMQRKARGFISGVINTDSISTEMSYERTQIAYDEREHVR